MRPLIWSPEPYPRSGGLSAVGFYKLLGRPRLDPLTVLVRETAQNSWDAREDETVRYRIDGLGPIASPGLDVLRDIVFPGAENVATGLEEALHSRLTGALVISDRGTRGLGGPLAADQVSSDGIYDWVDFVLNVGKPNLQGHTGGTYGFGKTIAFIVSTVSSIVIHSRTRGPLGTESRLIASAIGPELTHDDRLHTGRHWWGYRGDGHPVPVTGHTAEQIAHAIGMPERHGDELGTDILIVAPDFGGRRPDQAMRFLAEAITWHLWPKLMHHGPGTEPPMQATVTWNKDPIQVPRPEDRPPLHGFVQAFRALHDGVDEGRRGDGLERHVVRTFRPKADVGDLVTVPLVARHRAEVDDGHDPDQEDSPSPSAAIDGVCHHVALLRSPELVVDYRPGPVPQEGGTEWAAVFRCRDEVDGHFAQAEPPTHDSWRPELLQKSAGKTIVKMGLQRIDEFLKARWGPSPESTRPRSAASTAVVADELAHIVRGIPSLGAGGRVGGGPNGPTTSNRTPTVEIVETSVMLVDGAPASTAQIRLIPAKGSAGTRLHVSAGAALDDSDSDADLDPHLRLLKVEFEGYVIELHGVSEVIEIDGADEIELTLTVLRGQDTALRLSIDPESMDP